MTWAVDHYTAKMLLAAPDMMIARGLCQLCDTTLRPADLTLCASVLSSHVWAPWQEQAMHCRLQLDEQQAVAQVMSTP